MSLTWSPPSYWTFPNLVEAQVVQKRISLAPTPKQRALWSDEMMLACSRKMLQLPSSLEGSINHPFKSLSGSPSSIASNPSDLHGISSLPWPCPCQQSKPLSCHLGTDLHREILSSFKFPAQTILLDALVILKTLFLLLEFPSIKSTKYPHLPSHRGQLIHL